MTYYVGNGDALFYTVFILCCVGNVIDMNSLKVDAKNKNENLFVSELVILSTSGAALPSPTRGSRSSPYRSPRTRAARAWRIGGRGYL